VIGVIGVVEVAEVVGVVGVVGEIKLVAGINRAVELAVCSDGGLRTTGGFSAKIDPDEMEELLGKSRGESNVRNIFSALGCSPSARSLKTVVDCMAIPSP